MFYRSCKFYLTSGEIERKVRIGQPQAKNYLSLWVLNINTIEQTMTNVIGDVYSCTETIGLKQHCNAPLLYYYLK